MLFYNRKKYAAQSWLKIALFWILNLMKKHWHYSAENLEKENKLRFLLKSKKDSGKRKYTEESSNSRSPSKSQKRTPEYGQNI